jgi:DNA-binding response OmpR family regulator
MDKPTRCILIVEDHGQTSHVMARLVRARGFEVKTASSLAEARECASKGGVGFLISDLGLPDGNGCDLMAELQARYGIKGAAISGFGMESDVARSRQAGFVMHLTKPIRMAELDQVLALAKIEIEKAEPRPDEPGR